MFKPVTPKVDIDALELEQLEFWREKNVFHRSMDERKGGRTYVFYEGPPTANGLPGTHHVLARAFKDMFPRYKIMRGYHVSRRGGWDTHGLPVEIEGEPAGILVFTAAAGDATFTCEDPATLENLKEHIASAFMKGHMLEELRRRIDVLFVGEAEETWPRFLEEYAEGGGDVSSLQHCMACLHEARGPLRMVDLLGADLLAIAHNGNLSNGIMFPLVESFTGKPVELEYAQTRAKWEPLYEVTQIKGDGEAHPVLSPNDEFADYETWDKGNLTLTEAKTNDMLQYEYGRSGLKLGLQAAGKRGVNPYQVGFIGSTDSHTALATAALRRAGLDTVVEPIPTSAYPTPAARPANSRLDNRVLRETIGDLEARLATTATVAEQLDGLREARRRRQQRTLVLRAQATGWEVPYPTRRQSAATVRRRG